MNRKFLGLAFVAAMSAGLSAQQIKFEEYKLPNGLHVILHQDNTAPVVTTAVMYNVGSRDEQPGKTGFAHFFEHLLFEGTPNIPRGDWFKIVSSHGGRNNANTTTDRTYYYETFPSNNLEVGLWMEADRMLQPVINQIGVDTQKEVVKEEKRQRLDNAPYGRFSYGEAINPHMFAAHPYKNSVIGSFEDLSSAKLEDFQHFSKKFYVPNNAVLVVTGDFKTPETKNLINKYFAQIPRGQEVTKNFPKEQPITKPQTFTEYDSNIQLPLLAMNYRTPGIQDQDRFALDLLANYLSGGKTSVLYKKYVDESKEALQIFANNRQMVDYGIYTIGVIPKTGVSADKLKADIQKDIEKVQNELISEDDYQKLMNGIENDFISEREGVENIADALASAYMLEGDTNAVNTDLQKYRKVTREDIRNVARKYLGQNQQVVVNYLPKAADTKTPAPKTK